MKELLLIFLFQITFSLDTKIISVNYIHNFGKPSIKITLYENRTHYVYLNTFLPYTHLDKDDWPIDKKESTKIDLCHTYESFECESSLSTKNFEISSLLYYIGDNIHFGPDQGLALNYKFKTNAIRLFINYIMRIKLVIKSLSLKQIKIQKIFISVESQIKLI